jgi:hypothetical protein
MRELFVYYRVPRACVASAQAAVRAAQAALRVEHPGLVARLLRRDDDAAADPALPETWMETYAWPASPQGIDEKLQAAIEAGAAPLLALIDGMRHVEAFAGDAVEDGPP